MPEGTHFSTDADVAYNGIQFTEIMKSSVKSVPVYNRQGTSVKYVKHTISVVGYINTKTFGANDPTTDNNLEKMRKALLISGKDLSYKDKGFGNDFEFSTIATNKRSDVKYGPKPQILTFDELGCQKAARVSFTVEVHTVELCNVEVGGISEFWCTSNIVVNDSGYKTLTRRGRIEILANKQRGRLSNKLSEGFQPYINKLQSLTSMQGFHLRHTFEFNEDDTACDFVLEYKEIESSNPYPAGVVNIDFEHEMGSDLLSSNPFRKGFITWLNTAECTIKLRPGTPKVRAWAIFTNILNQRINQNVQTTIEKTKNGQVVTNVKVPIVLSLSIKENIFGHGVSFSCTWSTAIRNINDAFNTAGMFSPVRNVDWNSWTAEIRNVAQNPNGAYPLSSVGNTSLVVDPCNQTVEESIPDTTRPSEDPTALSVFALKCPPEESSWIDYQNRYFIISKGSRVVHRRYKKENEINRGSYQGKVREEALKVDNQYNKSVSLDDYNVQDFGNDQHKIRMKGFAIRMGRPTTPPEIKSVGGKQVMMLDDKSKITNNPISSFGGCPAYITTWDIIYEILGHPSGDLERQRVSTGENADHQ